MSYEYEIQFRQDSAANWISFNPTLARGEPGYEWDTAKLKIGDGVTPWGGLAYFPTGGAGALASFLFTQNTPAAVWTVNHGLGHEPLVQVRDQSGNVVAVSINHIDHNSLQIICDPPLTLAGTAYCL